ncbi:alpha,alpha-trehalose-phosphate synthase (UDP-forming) [Paeniglutamicibacter cryotolerans]|uniref:Trehalose 6-phosphate synthase n=1 Tax=Paeniglutamicibacter cryotolerans TaxID=670079 RepID=A0A839QIE2_9MICC|nr:trehalose-6-phosphate synthase [Paeniglutamicibacter cryotolerans]MBB2995383.1 trehalose 6-phosphate synthase [Paeniglutamicibacter cryotolerans]
MLANQTAPDTAETAPERFDFVVVANRLPVDRIAGPDDKPQWQRSPGGLVTALAPVMQSADGAWVGWHGAPDEELAAFSHSDMHLVPVRLSSEDVELYYEGFSNSTLWPLYHDVIVPPEFHRTWWERYKRVNARFAEAAARTAAPGATVWVQDYQLQLVPRLLRESRPDLRIGFFNHIPFPSPEIFAQMPWRRIVLEGLIGADLIGFQRPSDASNFLRSVRRFNGYTVKGPAVQLTDDDDRPARTCRAEAHPISIDSRTVAELAQDPAIIERSIQIRAELGNPTTILLGVDRLDYTKGIRHRLKAYGELLADRQLAVGDACLVQVASPSRESVADYMQLKDQVELTVGGINGEYDTMSHTAVRYLHHSYPQREMVALYLAADIMLVTALRDGMNLVAKEFVAAHADLRGVLVLSEFTGAADQLKQAVLVNPHDIDGLKAGIMNAVNMPGQEAARRMRLMRRQVLQNDVARWSDTFLGSLNSGAEEPAEPVAVGGEA